MSNYFGELIEVSDCCYDPAVHWEHGTAYCNVCGGECNPVYAENSQLGDETEPEISDELENLNENLDIIIDIDPDTLPSEELSGDSG